MLIFWDQRLVFLATPKAGSTAVEVALEPLASLAVQRPPEMKHVNAARFHHHIHPWLSGMTADHFTTVALMREPIDWLRSWYRFRQRDDDEDPDHAMTGISFAEFAAHYARPDGMAAARVGTQAEFLTDDGARVDCIFRYEDMDNFTHFLEDRLDCVLSLPRVNVPPAVDVSLNPGQEKTLRDIMDRDLRLYASL